MQYIIGETLNQQSRPFCEDEDDDSFSYSVRISAQDTLLVIKYRVKINISLTLLYSFLPIYKNYFMCEIGHKWIVFKSPLINASNMENQQFLMLISTER